MISWEFVLPVRLKTLNELLRLHFTARKKHMVELAWHVRAMATPPAKPLKRCRIVVERESTQPPDPDGIRATVKPLLDVLQPVSVRHPLGLGFIESDAASCIVSLEVRHMNGRGKTTRVVILEAE